MLGLQWILSIWKKKKSFSSLENILLDWYISLQISFLMFAILSGTPVSQMQSSWIDPLSHSSFLYFLSLCPFAPWYEEFPFSYHPTLWLNVFKFCLSYIYFDFQEFFLFSDFYCLWHLHLVIFSWPILIFLSLFFTFYVSGFSEKKAHSS